MNIDSTVFIRPPLFDVSRRERLSQVLPSAEPSSPERVTRRRPRHATAEPTATGPGHRSTALQVSGLSSNSTASDSVAIRVSEMAVGWSITARAR